MKNQLDTDCLDLEDSAESHAKWLHEWVLRHPSSIGRCVIVAAIIIAVAIIVAAWISRPVGERFKSIGTNRIFDVQTGEVKWADSPKD